MVDSSTTERIFEQCVPDAGIDDHLFAPEVPLITHPGTWEEIFAIDS